MISLKKIYNLITSISEKGRFEERSLFEDLVVSESHGISNIFTPENEMERKKFERLERFKIAVSSPENKMVFDVGSFKPIRWKSNDGEITGDMKNEMKKKVINHLGRIEKQRIRSIDFKKRL
jgi:hypothetical protein